MDLPLIPVTDMGDRHQRRRSIRQRRKRKHFHPNIKSAESSGGPSCSKGHIDLKA